MTQIVSSGALLIPRRGDRSGGLGPKRDGLWEEHVAQLPWFGDYHSKTDRRFPMVRLTPAAG